MSRVSPNVRRLFGWCAVAGAVLFTVAWLIAWWVQDVYSPRREDISALAALDAQHPWIMIGGIIALGLGLVALGVGLGSAIDDGRSATVGSALLVLAGLSFAVAGLARNDCSSALEACKERVDAGDVSWHHMVHDVVGIGVFLVLVVAPLLFARAFRADGRWSDLRRYSLATGWLTLALVVVFGAEVFKGWNGLVQRVLLALPLAWIIVLGTRVARISVGDNRTATT
jgi:hypothetical membrane protein